jgi:hypothetical protein
MFVPFLYNFCYKSVSLGCILKQIQDACGNAERSSLFIRDKPSFSSERMLHKGYYLKGSGEKKSLIVSLKRLDAKTN